MQKDEFITYLGNPGGLDEKSLVKLREILKDYPYFQAAHLLMVKNLRNLNHIKYDNQLRISAAYLGNRKLLFRLLYGTSTNLKISLSEAVVTEKQLSEEISENNSSGNIELKISESPKEKSIADIVLEQVQQIKQTLNQPANAQPIQNYEKPGNHIFGEVIEIDENLEITEDKGVFELHEDLMKTSLDLLVIDELPDLHKINFENEYSGNEPLQTEETGNTEQKNTKIETDLHRTEIHSFTSWVSSFKEDEHSDKSNPQNQLSPDHKKKSDLIDAFIASKPRMDKPEMLNSDMEVEDISRQSVVESEDFITETLAKIYVKQKKYEKALSFYEKLSLKYPEKVSYFAIQINEIKKLLTNNNS